MALVASVLTTYILCMVAHGSAEVGLHRLSAMNDLVNVNLRVVVPDYNVSIFYGAGECAIRNKDCGIWSITIDAQAGDWLLR